LKKKVLNILDINWRLEAAAGIPRLLKQYHTEDEVEASPEPTTGEQPPKQKNTLVSLGLKTITSVFKKSSSSDDNKELVNNEKYADVIFLFDKDEKINAHKVIICKCTYFDKMFEGDKDSSEMIREEKRMYNTNRRAFLRVMEFLYTQHADIQDYSEGIETMILADLYQIPSLLSFCELYLKAKLNSNNYLPLWQLADKYGCTHLQHACLHFLIDKKLEEVIEFSPDLLWQVLSKQGKPLFHHVVQYMQFVTTSQ